LNDGITTSSRVDSNGEISFPLNPHKALAHALVSSKIVKGATLKFIRVRRTGCARP
jgi:hypothetical protein